MEKSKKFEKMNIEKFTHDIFKLNVEKYQDNAQKTIFLNDLKEVKIYIYIYIY